MEGLEYCAKNSFNDQLIAFEEEPKPNLGSGSVLIKEKPGIELHFETIDIRHGVVGNGTKDAPETLSCYKRSQQQPATALVDFLQEQNFGETTPQLKLIRIQSQYSNDRAGSAGSFQLRITRNLFDHLLDQLRANPWVLWLISGKYDGFHHIKAQNKHADTSFFGFFHGAIVWTFLPETACTKVLLISRASSQHESFYALLNSFTPHLFTPLVPLMAATVDSMLSYDERLDRYLDDIIQVEQGTGFSWVGRDVSDLRFNVDALAKWSRVSAFVQINIINLVRHHESSMRALETIEELHIKGVSGSPNAKYKDDYDRSMMGILDAIRLLKMRADAFIPYATYLKNRVEAQISVIFAFLTHEDSSSNLRAAEASMAIAAATKRDSSAMKTIAFMTMAFLPATFLATLFALPVLDFESKTSVSMHGFRLYWAVAIPLTILTFIAWKLLISIKFASNGKERKTWEKKVLLREFLKRRRVFGREDNVE